MDALPRVTYKTATRPRKGISSPRFHRGRGRPVTAARVFFAEMFHP